MQGDADPSVQAVVSVLAPIPEAIAHFIGRVWIPRLIHPERLDALLRGHLLGKPRHAQFRERTAILRSPHERRVHGLVLDLLHVAHAARKRRVAAPGRIRGPLHPLEAKVERRAQM